MPLVQADDIADVVKGVMIDFGELKWTNIATNFQKYIFLDAILKKEKVGFKAGRDLQWNLQVSQNNSFRMVALGQPDVVQWQDTMQTASIPWRHATANWAIIEQLIKMDREPRTIVNLVKEQRAGAMISTAEGLETQGWSMPGGTGDVLSAFGIPYWLVPNTTQGFNGLNPFGYTAGAGGLSSVTYSSWANYTDSYAGVTKVDFIRKWRRAYVFCDFQVPTGVDVPSYSTGNKHGFYSTYYVVGLAEEILEQQNDNLGHDVASMDGKVTFRRVPLTWVPRLETLSGSGGMSSGFSNSSYTSAGGYALNPLFGINWGVFRPVFLEGMYMQEYGPVRVPFQHTVLQTFIDLTFNIECRDRRLNFVLTQ